MKLVDYFIYIFAVYFDLTEPLSFDLCVNKLIVQNIENRFAVQTIYHYSFLFKNYFPRLFLLRLLSGLVQSFLRKRLGLCVVHFNKVFIVEVLESWLSPN